MSGPINFQLNKKLSEWTTLGIGGAARFSIKVKDISKLREVLLFCKKDNLPYFVLGKGSNCFFDDAGFPGVVIANRIDFCQNPNYGLFHVGAGYSFSLLGVQTARQGWSGLEFACGIPGSVGGAVYMNAGANGQETSQCLVSVDFLTEEGLFLTIPRAKLEFDYRHSSFQTKQGVITGALFQLQKSETARAKQLEIINYRKKTQPYGDKSAGCVFRNPSTTLSAGALIDQLGLKQTTVGEASVSDLHANFLVNKGQATAEDFLSLIQKIQANVKEKKGIDLKTEVFYIPYHWTKR